MKASGDFPTINSKKPEGIGPDGEPYRVLVVDDSMFVRKQLVQILVSEGFEIIDQAEDGAVGVEKYKEHSPSVDLVTLDITMPRMDGISALEEILKFDPQAKCIMVSALGKQDLVKKAIIAGAKNYIIKPIDRKKVLERVLACIK